MALSCPNCHSIGIFQNWNKKEFYCLNCHKAFDVIGYQPEPNEVELLISLKPFTVNTPQYTVQVESVRTLCCQFDKGSTWHMLVLAAPIRYVNLWGEDFAIVSTILPSHEPCSEVKAGCYLSVRDSTFPYGSLPLKAVVLEEKIVPFLCSFEKKFHC